MTGKNNPTTTWAGCLTQCRRARTVRVQPSWTAQRIRSQAVRGTAGA